MDFGDKAIALGGHLKDNPQNSESTRYFPIYQQLKL
jgi:hypothetical protein